MSCDAVLAMRGILGVLVVVSACYGGIDRDPAGDPGAGSDPDPVVDAMPGHQMDGLDLLEVERAASTTRMTKIDGAPYPSALGAFTIDVYINRDARDYRNIHPDGAATHVTFDEGTLIVRKVLDATGAVTKITLMAKGPAGYAPTIGDWWFGVTDPSGAALPDGNGGFQVGKLTECYGCHVPHAANDYLFGVPAANQVDPGRGGT